ncbi:uncharacterized protein LOC132753412 [Ruditapes philippinarum]|uniref:uncharacterized protein LOC132753412 n=1 Tax=Ruditapes philippinarum TaxID=129788 RepID=UPI00295B7D7A|nr:uncharacterized protein LOC132753412 [Ruditapes philippinarum]
MQGLLDEPKLSVKEPYSIRWLGLKNAVEAVYESYGAILATLSSMADENSTAKGLYKYFASYKTALLLAFMLDVHTILGVLCCELQAKNLIFSDVPPLIDSTVEKIESMKSEEGNGLVEMKNSIVVKDEKAFYKGDELKYYSKDIESQFSNVKNNYLDNLAKNIKRRLKRNDSDTLIYLSQVLEPSTVCHLPADTSKSALECLGNQFGVEKTVKQMEGDLIIGTTETVTHVEPLLDKTKLEKEWKGVYGMVKGTYRNISLI